MPNRILRDWTTSETIDELSLGAEVLFTRLIMKADDYGNYTANIKLVKAALFPLKDYEEGQIASWVNECARAKILKIYVHDGKSYIHIPNFGQRLRAMKSQYPDYVPTNDSQVSDNGLLETKGNEVETNQKQKVTLRAFDLPFGSDDFLNAWIEWEQFRKELKKKITPSTAKKQLKFLGGRAEHESIAIINQSITNGWTGLFPLKNNNGTTDKRTEHIRSLATDFAERASQPD